MQYLQSTPKICCRLIHPEIRRTVCVSIIVERIFQVLLRLYSYCWLVQNWPFFEAGIGTANLCALIYNTALITLVRYRNSLSQRSINHYNCRWARAHRTTNLFCCCSQCFNNDFTGTICLEIEHFVIEKYMLSTVTKKKHVLIKCEIWTLIEPKDYELFLASLC